MGRPCWRVSLELRDERPSLTSSRPTPKICSSWHMWQRPKFKPSKVALEGFRLRSGRAYVDSPHGGAIAVLIQFVRFGLAGQPSHRKTKCMRDGNLETHVIKRE